jgi:hypothetical protein
LFERFTACRVRLAPVYLTSGVLLFTGHYWWSLLLLGPWKYQPRLLERFDYGTYPGRGDDTTTRITWVAVLLDWVRFAAWALLLGLCCSGVVIMNHDCFRPEHGSLFLLVPIGHK